MKKIYFLILLIALVGLSYFGGTVASKMLPIFRTEDSGAADSQEPIEIEIEEEKEEEEEIPEPDFRTVNMITTGNILAGVTQINQAKTGENEYDFSPSFEYIAPYLQAADLVVGDLEISQADPNLAFWGYTGYTGYPLFNAPPELSEALSEAGINALTLANNHALDRGYDGLMMTLDNMRGFGINTFGAYKSPEERDAPTILDFNGIDIALIGYTYGTNGIPLPEGHDYAVNIAVEFSNIEPVIADIKRAHDDGADIVAVFTHWGAEHSHEPNPQYLRQVAENLAAAGADLIIGGHPKWIQPIEWFFIEEENGSTRAALAVYSQGSFITYQHEGDGYNSINSEFSFLLDIELIKNYDTGEAWISDIDYEICWTHRSWNHRVLALSEIFEASPEDYNLTEARIDHFKEIHAINIDVIEKYGHPEDLVKAAALSDKKIEQASGQ